VVGQKMNKKFPIFFGISIIFVFGAYFGIVFFNQLPYTEKYQVDGRTIELTKNMCASVGVVLYPPQEFEDEDISTFLVLTREDLDEVPKLRDAVDVSNTQKFPLKYSISTFDLYAKDLIAFENYLMEKSIEKYGDSREDYFIQFDEDILEKLKDPKPQGFANDFRAPQIIYNDQTYSIGGTNFWMDDEHSSFRISVSLKETEPEKFVELEDDDLENIPKIKEAMEEISLKLDSILVFNGVTEEELREYSIWLDSKFEEHYGGSYKPTPVFIYQEKFYEMSGGIC
jgi:hypothetical protein